MTFIDPETVVIRLLCCLLLSLTTLACSHQGSSNPHRTNQPAKVVGGLRPEQVQMAIERNMLVLESALNDNWPGRGKVQMSFVVTPDGFPNSISVVGTDFNNPEFETALLGAVRRMSFPEAKSATYVRAYPMYFQ